MPVGCVEYLDGPRDVFDAPRSSDAPRGLVPPAAPWRICSAMSSKNATPAHRTFAQAGFAPRAAGSQPTMPALTRSRLTALALVAALARRAAGLRHRRRRRTRREGRPGRSSTTISAAPTRERKDAAEDAGDEIEKGVKDVDGALTPAAPGAIRARTRTAAAARDGRAIARRVPS